MTEQWREIRWRPGYEVSTEGRVRHDGKILKARSLTTGRYMQVPLGQPRVRAYIHRLVGDAFVANPHGYPEIDHIDGDPTNNRADNLEWVTHSENVKRSWARGRHGQGRPHPVTFVGTNGEATYKTIAAAAREFGVTPSKIKYALITGIECCAGRWRDA